jgi:hypothetical protein
MTLSCSTVRPCGARVCLSTSRRSTTALYEARLVVGFAEPLVNRPVGQWDSEWKAITMATKKNEPKIKQPISPNPTLMPNLVKARPTGD